MPTYYCRDCQDDWETTNEEEFTCTQCIGTNIVKTED